MKWEKLCQRWPWDYLNCIRFSSFVEVVLLWARNMAVLPPGLRWWGASRPQGEFWLSGCRIQMVVVVSLKATRLSCHCRWNIVGTAFQLFHPSAPVSPRKSSRSLCEGRAPKPVREALPIAADTKASFFFTAFLVEAVKMKRATLLWFFIPVTASKSNGYGATGPPGRVLSVFTRPELGLFGLVFTLKFLQLISTVDAWCFGVSTLHGYYKSRVSRPSPQKLQSSRDFCPTRQTRS